MSPSQAMTNRTAPSVRLHPPGLVCSLLASVSCHGLAPSVCLPSTFFGHGTRTLCLCLALCLFQFRPSFFYFSFLPSIPFFFYCQLISHPQSGDAVYLREKGKTFFHLGNKKKSNLSLSVSWLNVYPPHGVIFSTFSFPILFDTCMITPIV